MNTDSPVKMPVRALNGNYEVMVAEENTWVRCESKRDAEILAREPILRGAVNRPDAVEMVEDYAEMSSVMRKYGLFGAGLYETWATDLRDQLKKAK